MSFAIVDPEATGFLDTEAFDFIVVGGGTSGLVVATRLTENPNVRVLVLEAGSNKLSDPRIVTPGLAASLYDDPEFDWCFMSTPQKHLEGRALAQPRGKTLGGSTAINLGMVIYPSKSGLDGWEKLGNPGWNFKTLAPYFSKFSTLTIPSQLAQDDLGLGYLDKSIQGKDGPIQLSFGEADASTPFNTAWPKTFSTLKHELTGDPVAGEARGGFTNPGTVHPVTKARSHAGSDYLSKEVLERPNLRILTEVLVNKIILTKLGNELSATGVEITTKDGKIRNIFAKTEIVLAAGTIKTPQLLELSGIGDANLLKANNIEVLVDNPNVGENLQDHGYVSFSWEVDDDQISGDVLRIPEIAASAMGAYMTAQAGPLSGVPIVSAFMPIVDLPPAELEELLVKNLDAVEYPSVPSQKEQQAIIRSMLRSPRDSSGQYTMAPFQINPRDGPSCKGIYGMGTPGNYISIVSVLSHPLSRGSVHISSSDPTSQPIIDPKYLSHPLDLELHSRHVLWLETLAATEPMASLLKKDGRRIHAEEAVRDLETAKKMVKELFVSHYHVTSSCSMLPKELGGVVNDRLLVYGVRSLRIVDASIMPMIPRGNIQASVYAIAERAADIIKEDHLVTLVVKAAI